MSQLPRGAGLAGGAGTVQFVNRQTQNSMDTGLVGTALGGIGLWLSTMLDGMFDPLLNGYGVGALGAGLYELADQALQAAGTA